MNEQTADPTRMRFVESAGIPEQRASVRWTPKEELILLLAINECKTPGSASMNKEEGQRAMFIFGLYYITESYG